MVGTVGRLFLGVGLSIEARHALAAQLTSMNRDGLPGRIVPPVNWHLTLRFLGDVDFAPYDRLIHEMSSADLGGRFQVRFAGLGAFPRTRKATVLWAGINRGGESLAMLAEAVERAVWQAGLALEDRPFRAHLTLSRIRPPQDVSKLVEVSSALRVRDWVDSVTLFRSHLGSGGTRYEVLDKFELSPQ